MSIIEPKIDVLLNETDNDRLLLCALASCLLYISLKLVHDGS